jgi:hypothetical protein
LFIGTDDQVSFDSATWSSEKLSEYDHVTIRKDDVNWPANNQFYIEVESIFESYFQITAVLQDTYVNLVDGFPMHFAVISKSYLRYSIPEELAGGKIKCEIEPE